MRSLVCIHVSIHIYVHRILKLVVHLNHNLINLELISVVLTFLYNFKPIFRIRIDKEEVRLKSVNKAVIGRTITLLQIK